MHPLQHAIAVWHTVLSLPTLAQVFAAFGLVFVVALLTVLVHELAHWSMGKLFGVSGQLRIFARRGKWRFWFLAVVSMKFRDEDFPVLRPWQWRIVAASGPLVDITAGVACFAFGLHVPGPAWLSAGIALSGLFILPASLIMNIVPIRPLKNDGWLVIQPEAMVGKG